MSETEQIAKGIAAQRMKDDPLFREVMDEIRANLHRSWEQAQTTEAREAAWVKLQGVRLFDDALNGLIGDGKMAHKIAEERNRRTTGDGPAS